MGPLLSRRTLLRRGAQAGGALGVGLLADALAPAVARASGADDFGPLQPPDASGLMLPPGFTSRVVAVSDAAVGSTSHVWHRDPDGGATFATPDGGWIYVSNSERTGTSGGVGAIRFAADASIAAAYSILTGTARNCAGGPTPWGTWLSCEEVVGGRVYECDPFEPGSQGALRAALGTFNHEAAAVDPVHQTVYLTEDQSDGLLYRFTPSSYPSLGAGVMEAAEILDPGGQGPIEPGEVRGLAWHVVPFPSPAGGGSQNPNFVPLSGRATRYQVPGATPFAGGEGCWYTAGLVHFATKFDNRVWRLNTVTDQISIVYDLDTTGSPVLSGVDNVYAASTGDVYVAEDGGNLEIVALTPTGAVKPIVRLTGVSGTEITGPALSPDGTRLYFSSQRNPGVTYEVTGPFAPAPHVPLFAAAGRLVLVTGLAAAAWLRLRRG
jgi:hypothetical protein